VGHAVFYITFTRKTSFNGGLAVGLVRGGVVGQLRLSRLVPEGREPSLSGDFTLSVDVSGDASKYILNLYDLSLVSPSFPVEQVGRSMHGVHYRLSSEMIGWFEAHGSQYRPPRGSGEGFEGVFHRWQNAQAGAAGITDIVRLMNVLTFVRSHPFQRARGI
jgi:hypothetical protein